MTEKEERLLGALAWMCSQYLEGESGYLDHQCMGAGETATELLVEYGLLTSAERGATWTEAGKAFLDAH